MSMAKDESCLPCMEEKRIINEINQRSTMKEGDTYYLLSNRWYIDWNTYIDQDTGAGRPSPIDNRHLVISENDEDLQLRSSLLEGIDYVLVPEEVWNKLYNWYQGGPALPRKVISQGLIDSLVVELHPLRLRVHDSRDGEVYVVQISKKASMNYLYDCVKRLLGLEAEKIHLSDYSFKIKGMIYIASNKSLEDAIVMMDEDILVEVENPVEPPRSNEGAFVEIENPVEPPRSIVGAPNSSSNGYSTWNISKYFGGYCLSSPLTLMDAADEFISGEVKKGDMGGRVGLQNLGNTCFMNSAIQCLVHTPPLVEYFMRDYSEEINKQNPLGMQGELAIAFGNLLRKLWSSRGASISPSVFKTKLAQFAPQFSGYKQHDSHELLAFLMDGLHEDLNRVKVKPYIELKDANGRPDDEVANECWDFHKARNDSVIVDVCQGQYKLTLVCPECSRVSVAFDPFMYLSLPLSSEITRSMTITVFCGNGSALPMKHTVKVLRDGSVQNLVDALSTECCLKNDETLLLAEIYNHAIFRYLKDPSDPVSVIQDRDYIVAYRLPKKPEGYKELEIMHGIVGKKLLGTPIVTYLAEGQQSSEHIQNAVHMALNPLLTDMEIPTKSVDNGKLEADHKFNLLASDDNRGRVCRPIKSDFTGQLDRVVVDWSDTDLDMYDIRYLEDIPAVYKPGFGTAISLLTCLEAFLKEEPLGPDDMWFCPSCKEHRQASKKLDLWKLPEILVVHLKRFAYSEWYKNKLDTFVDFPIRDFDLKKYVKGVDDPAHESCIYELYAVSNHYGSLGGGHYTAYAKVEGGNKWYHFDDRHVSPIKEDEIKTSAAYVLFYKRVRHNEESSQAAASCSSSV